MTPLILRVICSWCSRVLCEGTPGALTSHGLCPQCATILNAELDAPEAA